jgi:hypothetical protein
MPPFAEPLLGADDFWAEAETLGRILAATLDYYQYQVLEGLPVQLPPPGPVADLKGRDKFPGRHSQGDPAHWAPAARDLTRLAELTAGCRACPRGQTRDNGEPAFGRGSDRPLLVIVGQDPGLYEGPEADLLAAILEKGLKLDQAH